MQRYIVGDDRGMGAELVEDENGDVVLYDDAQAEIARLTAALAESEAKLKAARDAQIARGDVFADTNPEARWIADSENDCPACGGSGHKDDLTAALRALSEKNK